jgi:hypothetical protein
MKENSEPQQAWNTAKTWSWNTTKASAIKPSLDVQVGSSQDNLLNLGSSS